MKNVLQILLNIWREIECIRKGVSWKCLYQVFGPPAELLKPTHPKAEFALIWKFFQNMELRKIVKLGVLLAGSVFVPFLGVLLTLPLYLENKSLITSVGKEFGENNETFKETWMQVNGVCTDREFQGSVGEIIAELFQRDIMLFWNPTQGMLFDLIECMMGRTFNGLTTIGQELAKSLEIELKRKEKSKVVLLAHSQGAIIASNAISTLVDRKVLELEKLEVYTFGSAADSFRQMEIETSDGKKKVPLYEHFANHGDLIAQIGVLHWMFTKYSGSRYNYPGRLFVSSKSGHLLGEHYLKNLRERQYNPTLSQDSKDIEDLRSPKIYSYIPNEFHFMLCSSCEN